jgi:hypothetical protein
MKVLRDSGNHGKNESHLKSGEKHRKIIRRGNLAERLKDTVERTAVEHCHCSRT